MPAADQFPLPDPPDLPGVEWRPQTVDDAAAISAMLDACFEVDLDYRTTPEEVRTGLEDTENPAEENSLIGTTQGGEAVAHARSIVPTKAATKWRAWPNNTVRPEYRGRGIGAFLLRWFEQRSRQRLSQREDELPKMLETDAYDWQRDRIELFEQNGYEPVRYFVEMIRDLGQPIDEVPPPEGIEIVPMTTAALQERARVVHNEAFQDHWGSQPVTAERWHNIYLDKFFLPESSYVALHDDGPVAYLMAGKYPHDFEDRGRTESWIEGLGTVRSHRGKGLASALIRRSMHDFSTDGMDYACLGVDSENESGAFGLYERLGFVPERRSISFAKPAF